MSSFRLTIIGVGGYLVFAGSLFGEMAGLISHEISKVLVIAGFLVAITSMVIAIIRSRTDS